MVNRKTLMFVIAQCVLMLQLQFQYQMECEALFIQARSRRRSEHSRTVTGRYFSLLARHSRISRRSRSTVQWIICALHHESPSRRLLSKYWVKPRNSMWYERAMPMPYHWSRHMSLQRFDGTYSCSMLVLNAGVSRAHIGCMASVTNILSCRFERNFALQFEGGDFLHVLRCNRGLPYVKLLGRPGKKRQVLFSSR